LFAAAPLLGCVHTQAVVLDPSFGLRPTCPEAVLLFTTAERVGRPYVEVALLSSRGDNNLTSESEMHESQRQKAARLGANGVILGETRDAGAVAVVANAVLGTPADRRGRAVAIWIAEDSVRVQEVCARARPRS
jgi:hypothetical protein